MLPSYGGGGIIMWRWSHGKSIAYQLMRKVESDVMFLVYILGPELGLVAEKRGNQFGKHLLVSSELRQEHWSSLLKFAKNSKRFQ